MTLLLAAVGATVTALLELSLGPYLRVANAEPQLVLVVGIVVTLALESRSRARLGLRRRPRP